MALTPEAQSASADMDELIHRLESQARVKEVAAALDRADERRTALFHAMAPLRKARAMSQSVVARWMGTSQPAVARLEAGLADPRLSTLERYAAAIGYELHMSWVRSHSEPEGAITDVPVEAIDSDSGHGSGQEPRLHMRRVSMQVNGADCSAEVEPRVLLVDFIRTNLRLTGTHIGCDTSSCGACTVLLDGEPVKSCALLAVQADGCRIKTVEGLAQGTRLAPIQAGFHEEHALQCGFCTPGMMLVGEALLERNPNPSEEEIRWAISGNLCRCTGYMNIVKAVQHAARSRGVPAVVQSVMSRSSAVGR